MHLFKQLANLSNISSVSFEQQILGALMGFSFQPIQSSNTLHFLCTISCEQESDYVSDEIFLANHYCGDLCPV